MTGTDHRLRLDAVSARRDTPFELTPDSEERAGIVAALDLDALRKMRFAGVLRPVGRDDWVLEATLGATVVQPCAVTLAPVTTRIDVPVTRRYLAETGPEPEGEVEMPEDVEAEPRPATLDLWEVATEALALALPDFPRAEGAELGESVHAPPGETPLRDADLKPFAGLAALKGGDE